MPSLRPTTSMQVMNISTISSQPDAKATISSSVLDGVADAEQEAHAPALPFVARLSERNASAAPSARSAPRHGGYFR